MLRLEVKSGHPDNLSSLETESSEKYALLSVADKAGVADLARALDILGYRIISTGGTAKALTDEGIQVTPIEDITGNPESFDGRMKTISFQVEGGILYDRTNLSHVQQAKELGVKNIDLVVANFYPFERTSQNPDSTLEQSIEDIDVGGPTMVRAAAKNFKNVLVIVDPEDYPLLIQALENKSVDDEFRQALAAKAFQHLAFYDAQIAQYLTREQFPQELALPVVKSISLRYGENPHQKGTVYFEPNTNSPLNNLERHIGRELSYLNFTDIAAGVESVRVFQEPAAVVIKHNSPSGIALGSSSAESLMRAIAADPESAFGGVIVLNQLLDMTAAQVLSSFKEENSGLIDIIAAPHITNEAMDFIRKVRKTTGIYTFGEIPKLRSNPNYLKFFDGGFIIQDWDDDTEVKFPNWKVGGEFHPTHEQLIQMQVAWKFISRIRSNSIIVVDKDIPMTRGIGSGQTSRVRAVRIALEQAANYVQGGILASDSFFPFDDSVKLAAKYGIGAIVQQGGSVNDKASILAANEVGIPIVLTGERKFWH